MDILSRTIKDQSVKQKSKLPARGSGFRPSDTDRETQIDSAPGLRARLAAQNILLDIVTNGHVLDERFSATAIPNRLTGLDARDQALVRSIVVASLRRLGAIRFILARLLEQGLPRNAGQIEWILIVGLCQILFLDAADHAAVDLAVRAARLDAKSAGYAGLVNAVLRNAIRQRDEMLAAADDSLEVDAPSWLAQRWRRNWGEERARAIADAHKLEPTLDITAPNETEEWAKKLDARLLPTRSLRIASHAPVPDLPGYADGQWWVQDAAAAIPAQLLHVKPGDRVADLCAAPGGKTMQLAAAGADVLALDRSAERLRVLASNLERNKLRANFAVGDAATFSAAPFDAVLIDPPCSSTGVIRRNPDVQWTKKPGDLEALIALQTRILNQAAKLVKPDGLLVYCVCSIEPEEGEQQIAALLRRNPDFLREKIAPGECGVPEEFINSDGELRILPCFWPDADPRMSGLDGFFAARLRRKS